MIFIDHRKKASDYRLLAEVADSPEERAEYLRLAQEHLLMVEPDPLMMPPRPI